MWHCHLEPLLCKESVLLISLKLVAYDDLITVDTKLALVSFNFDIRDPIWWVTEYASDFFITNNLAHELRAKSIATANNVFA